MRRLTYNSQTERNIWALRLTDSTGVQAHPRARSRLRAAAVIVAALLTGDAHVHAQSPHLSCEASPARVYPGQQVKAVGTLAPAPQDGSATWSWQTNGGQVVNIENTATVSTAGLAPGEYTIVGRASLGRRPGQQASCSALFVVRSYDAPTATCTVTPSAIVAGADAVITIAATSPQSRPLHYEFASSAGVLSPNGSTARLSTAGLAPMRIAVTCKVADDLGHDAVTGTQLAVTAPPPPIAPRIQELCVLSFVRDPRRPVRVDNEAKGCLDDIALTLHHETDTRLVMVGNASPEERPEVAAQRVLNAREYMTREKGIDPARIQVRVGETSGTTVGNFLLPPGAVFQDAFTQRFDERSIARHGEPYGRPGASRKAAAVRPATPVPTPAPPPGQVPKPTPSTSH